MIAVDPKQTIDLSLPGDMDEPLETRPIFRFRYLSCREMIEFDRLLQDATAAEPRERWGALSDAANLAMLTWLNVRDREGDEVLYDPVRSPGVLLDLLAPTELANLTYRLADALMLSGEERKKSDSPSQTSSDNSAAAPSAQE